MIQNLVAAFSSLIQILWPEFSQRSVSSFYTSMTDKKQTITAQPPKVAKIDQFSSTRLSPFDMQFTVRIIMHKASQTIGRVKAQSVTNRNLLLANRQH